MRQTETLASVICLVSVVSSLKGESKKAAKCRREFNHEHCLSHNFLSGCGPVDYSYASFLVSPKPSCHYNFYDIFLSLFELLIL